MNETDPSSHRHVKPVFTRLCAKSTGEGEGVNHDPDGNILTFSAPLQPQ